MRRATQSGRPAAVVARQSCAGHGCGSTEELSMSIKSKVFVAAATPTLAGGGSTMPNGQPSPNEPAFEVEYAPFGVNSGLCMGLATTALPGEGVTLQPCGVSSKTVWILDTFDQSFPAFLHGYFPAINGSDT